MRFLVLLVWFVATPVWAAYPYDAVGVTGNGGSGTMVVTRGGKGLVITAGHVVTTDAQFKITWGNQSRIAKVVAVDPDNDLAIAVVDRPPVKGVGYGKIQGRLLVVTGYPWHSRKKLHWQVGTVRPKMEEGFTLTMCKPEPGLSGGGCFDFTGHLVAVVSGHDAGSGYMGYKVPELLDKYKDPETWVPDASHVKEPVDYGPSAKRQKPYRTNPYNQHTAPVLPDTTVGYKLH